MDPLNQLALCCGLGARRKEYSEARSQFYSPSTFHLDPITGWTVPGRYTPQPAQPYLILTQPLIIANHPAANQTNTMTLVQHSQTAHATGAIPGLPFLTTPQGPVPIHQPNMIASQYAIYETNQPAAMSSALVDASPRADAIYQPAKLASTSSYQPIVARKAQVVGDKQPAGINQLVSIPSRQSKLMQQQERPVLSLSSDIFRQLETIEKQVDLSRDMDLVERHGIVITRALNPYSLMPHLTEATLRRYNTNFLLGENSVIRFIEIIKRPGQTLGLYIRTVFFEEPGGSSREGLVITKIDSDSPIYDSQVLCVGDEILSVNLVEIQGISLDDVVVIMSIPKRLVLALRIPKDRDQMLNMNLLQQQQVVMDSIVHRDEYGLHPRTQPVPSLSSRHSLIRTNSSGLYDVGAGGPQTSQASEGSTRSGLSGLTSLPYNTMPLPAKQPVIGNIRLAETNKQSSYFSSSIDAINRELKELRRQREALGDEQDPNPM